MSGETTQSIVLPGPEPLVGEIAAVLELRGHQVRKLLPGDPVTAVPRSLVIPVLWLDKTAAIEAIGAELAVVGDTLKSIFKTLASYPCHVTVVAPLGGTPARVAGRGALITLIGYLTSHLIYEDVRINGVLCNDDAQGYRDAADAVAIFASGLLDDVKGQSLRLEGRSI